MLVTKQPVLRRFWYPVMPLNQLDAGPQPFTLLGEPIVLWKRSDGSPACVKNRCCHRTARLSKGFVDGDWIVCACHGWTYDATGKCVRIPQNESRPIPESARVPGYHCQARYGYVWVALADPLKPIVEIPEDAAGYRRMPQYWERWEAGALRLMENSSASSCSRSYAHMAKRRYFAMQSSSRLGSQGAPCAFDPNQPGGVVALNDGTTAAKRSSQATSAGCAARQRPPWRKSRYPRPAASVRWP